MDKLLKQFYMDEHMRNAVQAFLIETLEQEALKKIMSREDVSGFADAHAILKKSFIRLQESFGEEPKPNTKSTR